MARSGKIFAFTEEELAEIRACLQEVGNEHEDTIKEIVKDDSTTAEEFRNCIADENKRQTLRVRILNMLKGGE